MEQKAVVDFQALKVVDGGDGESQESKWEKWGRKKGWVEF